MVSGNPMLIQDAIRSVSKWRYQPVNRDGEAVEVITTITVTFKMEAGAEPSGDKSAKAPEETSRPETIHLKNGRIIYADTTTDDGAKIEYSIGESIFEIPKSLIQSIDHGSGTATRASSSTSWPNQKSPSAVVTGTPLNKIPVAFGEDTKNWYLDESTEQLREECRSGEFYDRFHPEMQSASSFPNKEDSDRICAVISMDMGYRYENLINRGLELERSLCFAKDGMFSNLPAADPKIRNEQEELKRVSAEFLQRMTDFQKNPSARGGGSRLLLDYYRLGSRCGHGMGF
jgi:hypothetical protein